MMLWRVCKAMRSTGPGSTAGLNITKACGLHDGSRVLGTKGEGKQGGRNQG